jgi:integrase
VSNQEGGEANERIQAGGVYWYKFRFEGQVVRESARTASKTVAQKAERARRRQLEDAANGIARRERPVLFPIAADRWLDSLSGALKPITLGHYRIYAGKLKERFPNRLVIDIDERDVAELQRKLTAEGFAGRTVNLQIAVLRMILRFSGTWGAISGRVRMLRERHDVGRAISREDEQCLLDAVRQSRSPALYPLFVLSIDTGLRASEVRGLKHSDLTLEWRDGVIRAGELQVSKSKTEAGEGRIIPLTSRVCAALSLWLTRFPDAGPAAHVFPAHKIGFTGNTRRSDLYDIDLSRPMGTWKKAWTDARSTANVQYRWHDLRHSFVSRLASNPQISEATLRALSGHVSKRMLEHYSHVHTGAKQTAIQSLETTDFEGSRAQKWAQSSSGATDDVSSIPSKTLN